MTLKWSSWRGVRRAVRGLPAGPRVAAGEEHADTGLEQRPLEAGGSASGGSGAGSDSAQPPLVLAPAEAFSALKAVCDAAGIADVVAVLAAGENTQDNAVQWVAAVEPSETVAAGTLSVSRGVADGPLRLAVLPPASTPLWKAVELVIEEDVRTGVHGMAPAPVLSAEYVARVLEGRHVWEGRTVGIIDLAGATRQLRVVRAEYLVSVDAACLLPAYTMACQSRVGLVTAEVCDVRLQEPHAAGCWDAPTMTRIALPVDIADWTGYDAAYQELADLFRGFVEGVPAAARSWLVRGPCGSGKTSTVLGLAQSWSKTGLTRIVSVDAHRLAERYPGAMDSGLVAAFEHASRGQPALIVMDNVDALFPAHSDGTEGNTLGVAVDDAGDERLCLQQFVNLMQARGVADRVAVVGICVEADSLHADARRQFEEEVALDVPSPDCRLAMLQDVCRVFGVALDPSLLHDIVTRCHGYIVSDLIAVMNRATKFGGDVASWNRAISSHVPILFNGAGISKTPWTFTRPDVTWDDVGGLTAVKEQLQHMVVLPFTHPDMFKAMGFSPPTGLLMYGVPGTGKTLIAKAVASQCSANFLNVSIPDLMHGYVGESEKALASVFRMAARCSPCVIFFDEFQAVFGSRADDASASTHMVTQMLLEMSAVSQRSARVVVLAATNVPEAIDPAFFQPGRFDRVVYVPPPTVADREHILMSVHEDVYVPALAQMTPNFTGADLANLCRHAAAVALQLDRRATCVHQSDFLKCLVSVKASLDTARVQALANMRFGV